MSTTVRNVVIWGVIVIAIILLYNFWQKVKDPSENTLSFSEFISMMKEGKIRAVKLYSSRAEITTQHPNERGIQYFRANIPRDSRYHLAKDLIESGARVELAEPEESTTLLSLVSWWLPFLLFLGFWIFIMRQMRRGGRSGDGR